MCHESCTPLPLPLPSHSDAKTKVSLKLTHTFSHLQDTAAEESWEWLKQQLETTNTELLDGNCATYVRATSAHLVGLVRREMNFFNLVGFVEPLFLLPKFKKSQ